MTVRILTGDCRTVLATLLAGSVQTCVTSPPYFGLRAYLDANHPDKHREVGTEQTPDAYVAEMVGVFREVRRVLTDDGTLWLNLGDSYASSGGRQSGVGDTDRGQKSEPYQTVQGTSPTHRPLGYKPKDLLMIPARVALALQADGWFLRSDIIWHKPSPMPESVTDRPTSAHEHVFLLSKRSSYFYDADAIREPFTGHSGGPGGVYDKLPAKKIVVDRNDGGGYMGRPDADGRNARNVWTIATQPYSGAHFATMPPALVERCVKAGTSERGQCPHCAAPWVRVVETERVKDPRRHTGRAAVGCSDRMDADQPRMLVTNTTTGWAPSCTCPEHQPISQTVLDPFSGAGTTALVASRLGRSAIGIELNPTYAEMARARIHDDCPMFAGVAAE